MHYRLYKMPLSSNRKENRGTEQEWEREKGVGGPSGREQVTKIPYIHKNDKINSPCFPYWPLFSILTINVNYGLHRAWTTSYAYPHCLYKVHLSSFVRFAFRTHRNKWWLLRIWGFFFPATPLGYLLRIINMHHTCIRYWSLHAVKNERRTTSEQP